MQFINQPLSYWRSWGFVLSVACLPACSGEALEPGAASGTQDEVSTSTSQLSAALAERVIPLHFMSMVDTSPATPLAATDSIQRTIDVANRTFRSTGVQFVMGRNDATTMPIINANLADPTRHQCWKEGCGGVCVPGTSVSGELSAALHLTTEQQESIPACEQHIASDWAGKVTIQFAKNGEIFLWIQNKVNYSTFPDAGRSVSMLSSYFDSSNYLAHELGHYFGLGHADGSSFDSRANAWAAMTDMWDMIYLPGCLAGQGFGCPQPHKFFASKDEAVSFVNSRNAIGQGLQWIERGPVGLPSQTCIVDGTAPSYNGGRITCKVGISVTGYIETLTSDAPGALAGRMLFHGAGVNNAPQSSVYGANVMDYTNNSLTDRADGMTESQVMIVRNALRYDVPINMTDTNVAHLNLPGGLSGGRPLLGGTEPTTPLSHLDLDKDGHRDLAFWYAATRQFKVALSSRSFSTAATDVLTLTVGSSSTPPGVPFAGDINGDGRSDLGTYSAGVWRYCLTNAKPLATTCATPSVIKLGDVSSKPAGVHRMTANSTVGSVVVLSPKGVWSWKNAAGATGTASLGNASEDAWGTAQALPGAYDSDDLDDLVVYRAANAMFSSFRSSDRWASQIDTPFPGEFQPGTSGSPYSRSGAVVVPGMTWRKSTGEERLALALWQPEMNTWTVDYDPFGSVQRISEVAWGVPGDIPLGGLGLGARIAGSYRFSNLSVYRSGPNSIQSPPLTVGHGYLFRAPVNDVAIANTATLTTAPYFRVDQGVASARLPVFSVSDMTGDGQADVIRLDPETNAVTIFRSPDFTTQQLVTLGDGSGEIL